MSGAARVAAGLKGRKSGEGWSVVCPCHNDRNPSLSVTDGDDGRLLLHCFAGCQFDDILAELRRRGLVDDYDQRPRMSETYKETFWGGAHEKVGKSDPPTAYVYCNADSTPRLRVNRTQNRNPPFWQEHYVDGQWRRGGGSEPKVPYRLPDLLLYPEAPVLIVEGEKDADNVMKLGDFIATTNAGGAKNWHADLNQYFKGRDVILVPDNDKSGEEHAATVYENLKGVAASIKVLRLPGLPDKGDISDWIEAGGTLENLIELLKTAPAYEEAAPKTEPSGPIIKSSAEFLKGFVPPDYVLDGALVRGFLYSLTGQTGSGKTCLTLRLAASTALGQQFAGRDTKRCRVLYAAAENPTDVVMRWIALAQHMGFDPDEIEVYFVSGAFSLKERAAQLRTEAEAIGGSFGLVIVDTGPVFFEGDDESNRKQMGDHARMMRNLIEVIPGRPCVIVNCHPVKNATADNLLPAGGGTFLNEVDGNLTCAKHDSLTELHWQGKFRGVEFAPMSFLIKTVTHERLKDQGGRLMPTVICEHVGEQGREEIKAAGLRDEDEVLRLVAGNPKITQPEIARALGWKLHNGEPNKVKAGRVLKALIQQKLVKAVRGKHDLTEEGKNALKGDN
jgi:hypothetical protein